MTYFRRFRMEFEFGREPLPEPALPPGYQWLAWRPELLSRHATVKWESFRDEMDSRVFPCLGELEGCQNLMREIARHSAFIPGATWLIATSREQWGGEEGDCGTIQGLAHSEKLGAIQNVGVAPEHRGLGLGRALVLKSLHGFREAGMQRVYLEVTADNLQAVELYRAIGFKLTRTMYKSVPRVEPQPL